jgi:hypothetical protein
LIWDLTERWVQPESQASSLKFAVDEYGNEYHSTPNAGGESSKVRTAPTDSLRVKLQADNAPLATMSSQLVSRDACQRHPALGIARRCTDSACMQMQQTPLFATQHPFAQHQDRGEQTQLPDSSHVPLRLGSGVAHPSVVCPPAKSSALPTLVTLRGLAQAAGPCQSPDVVARRVRRGRPLRVEWSWNNSSRSGVWRCADESLVYTALINCKLIELSILQMVEKSLLISRWVGHTNMVRLPKPFRMANARKKNSIWIFFRRLAHRPGSIPTGGGG